MRTSPQDSIGPAALVLIVDDYADAREMCAEYLDLCGFRVEQACDGAEALKKAAHLRPDVILMDLSLPDIDGVEVARRLKAASETAGIAIIALTGHGTEEHADKARAAGCVSFLVKPCQPDAMISEIRRVMATGQP